MTSNFHTSPLISAEELSKIMHQPHVKIYDVRGKWGGDPSEAFKAYTISHIEGATFLDWNTHFVTPDTPINLAPVANEQVANQSFEVLGISEGDLVVLYDDYYHMLAGRMWWAMRFCGFSNIKILNGGWKNWQAHNLPVSSTPPMMSKGTFRAKAVPQLRTSLSKLIEIKDQINLIDARGSKGYQGSTENDRSGHIPGAINIPYSEVLDAISGLFKSESELRALFEDKLSNFPETQVVSSCGAGYAGTVVLLALQSIGIEAPLFDDSFSVWKMDESRPIEKG